MPKVPPGNETGFYYIIVGSLPWNTNWQHLKDFVRGYPGNPHNIIRAHVCHRQDGTLTTNGWVCIRGYEDYATAFQHLRDNPLDGRYLIVDGRNANEETHVPALTWEQQPPVQYPTPYVQQNTYTYGQSAPEHVTECQDSVPRSESDPSSVVPDPTRSHTPQVINGSGAA